MKGTIKIKYFSSPIRFFSALYCSDSSGFVIEPGGSISMLSGARFTDPIWSPKNWEIPYAKGKVGHLRRSAR